MKIAIVVNGISPKKKAFYKTFLPQLKELYPLEILETQMIHDAEVLASTAVEGHFDVILAAGGDGTVNQVVNGILRGRESHVDLPVVGVVPIGTGNDLARGLNLKEDINQLLMLLNNFEPEDIDIGKVEYTTEKGDQDYRYFVNVVDIGMGPEVVKKVMRRDQIFGAALSYYISILSTFTSYKPMVASANTPDWEWSGKLRTLAIANGKYYGNGLCIAPDAQPNDRVFETFICGNASILDFVLQSQNMKRGRRISHDAVLYRQGSEFYLSAESSCCIEADGEFLGWLPASVKLTPQRLRFLM